MTASAASAAVCPHRPASTIHGHTTTPAAEAITLLKNDGGVLPLARTSRVLVTGPTADYIPSMYGGWSYTWQGTDTAMYPKNIKSLLAAVRDQVGAANVTYVPGASFTDTLDISAAVAAALSWVAVYSC